MQAVVKAAHKRGKLVIVHAFAYQSYLDVIAAGADGVAHLPIVQLPGKEFAELAQSHHHSRLPAWASPISFSVRGVAPPSCPMIRR